MVSAMIEFTENELEEALQTVNATNSFHHS